MSVTHAPLGSIATPGTLQTGARQHSGVAFNPDDVGGARLLVVDVGMRSVLIHEWRLRLVTRVFGIPRDEQSFLVTMILVGAVATVVRDFAAPLWPRRPSGAEAAIGGAVLNATLRGLAGPPSRSMRLAGVMIACAMLSHSLRPAVVGSAGEIRTLSRDVRAALGGRYGH